MTITPEEIFNKQVWEILQKIKEENLATEKNKPVKYRFGHVQGTGIIPRERKESILFKLQEWGALKVRDDPFVPPIPADGEIYLDLIQPKFDEIYEKYSDVAQEENRLVKMPLSEPNGGNLTEIVIADLEAMHEEIKTETNTQKYYQKSANYGKYLIETEELQLIQAPLYKDAEQDVASYKKACDEFWEQWQACAGDLIKKTEGAGIKDHPVSPLISQIYQLKEHLKQKPDYNDDYLSNYYLPYKELIERFEKENKTELILGDHVIETDGNKHIKLYDTYSKARDEWDKFERLRETRVWWAHYQLMRLTYSVIELKDKNPYFNNDNIIDQLYQYDFSQVAKGGNSVFIKKKSYEEWIQRVHKYLIPRLKFFETTKRESKKADTGNNIQEYRTKEEHKQRDLKTPQGWLLISDIKKPQLKRNNEIVYEFPTNWSDKYRYFECLWENYGQKIKPKQLYEYKGKDKYPEKGQVWKINKGIGDEITKLWNEFESANLPLRIDRNNGYTLTIEEVAPN